MEALAAVAAVEAELVDFGGDVEEALGAKEEAFAGAVVEGEAEGAGEWVGVEVQVFGAALEVAGCRPRCPKPNWPAMASSRVDLPLPFSPVKKAMREVKRRDVEGLNGGNGERVDVGVGDAFAQEVEGLEHGLEAGYYSAEALEG